MINRVISQVYEGQLEQIDPELRQNESISRERSIFLTNIFNNFQRYLDPSYIESLENQGELIPWDVQIDTTTSVARKMTVRYSEEFCKKYSLNYDNNDPSIFTFTLNNSSDSYQKLKQPFEFVEVNLLVDSGIDRTFKPKYQTWKMTVDNDSTNLVTFPKGVNVDFGTINRLITNLVRFDDTVLTREVRMFEMQNGDKLKEVSPDFAKEVFDDSAFAMNSRSGLKNLTKMFDLSKDKLPKEFKVFFEKYIRLVAQSTLSDEDCAYNFLDATDLTQSKRRLKKIIVAGAGISTALIANALILKYGLDNEAFKQINEWGRDIKGAEINELEKKGVHSGAQLLKTLNVISEDYGVHPNLVNNRFFGRLRDVTKVLHEIVQGIYEPDNFFHKPELPEVSFDDVSTVPLNINEDSLWDGSDKAVKGYLTNFLNIFKFYKSSFLTLNEVEIENVLEQGERYSYSSNDYVENGIVKTSPPYGRDWNMGYKSVETLQHEMNHRLHDIDLPTLMQNISLDDYTHLLGLQLKLSKEILDFWLEKDSSTFVLFDTWAYNYSLDQKEFPEIEFEKMVTDMFPEDQYYWSIDQTSYRINYFMEKSLLKYREISDKQKQGISIIDDEVDFLRKYYKYRIGDMAISHVCHHLEYFLTISNGKIAFENNEELFSETERKIRNAQNEIFKEVCVRLLDRNPSDIIKNIHTDIIGDKVKKELGVPNIFNKLGFEGEYANNGDLIAFHKSGYIEISPYFIGINTNTGERYLMPSRSIKRKGTLPDGARVICNLDDGFLSKMQIGIYEDGTILTTSNGRGKVIDNKFVTITDVEQYQYDTLPLELKSERRLPCFIAYYNGESHIFPWKYDQGNENNYVFFLNKGKLAAIGNTGDDGHVTITPEMRLQTEIASEIIGFVMNKREGNGVLSSAGKIYYLKNEDYDSLFTYLSNDKNDLAPHFRYKVKDSKIYMQIILFDKDKVIEFDVIDFEESKG